MTIDHDANKEKFLATLRKVERAGIEDLIQWLETTDFFEAPASTKYHLAVSGGLCQHSLDVFNELIRLKRAYPEFPCAKDTAIIISLLHDLCKANFYKTEMRNTKVDGQWVQVPYYTVDEQLKFGLHGAKSAYLAMRFIQLTEEEAVAITNHMGGFAENPQGAANAYKAFPVAWLLHVADESASYIVEQEGTEAGY